MTQPPVPPPLPPSPPPGAGEPGPDGEQRWGLTDRRTWDAVFDPPGTQPAPPTERPQNMFGQPVNPNDPRAPWGRDAQGDAHIPTFWEADKHYILKNPMFLGSIVLLIVIVLVIWFVIA